MELRVARHTERLDEVATFYRDGIGLTEIGGFHDHDGYDGVFLAVPGTGAHLELTAGGGHGASAPHPESLLVLYLGDDEAVQTVAARRTLMASGSSSCPSAGSSKRPAVGRAKDAFQQVRHAGEAVRPSQTIRRATERRRNAR